MIMIMMLLMMTTAGRRKADASTAVGAVVKASSHASHSHRSSWLICTPATVAEYTPILSLDITNGTLTQCVETPGCFRLQELDIP